VILRRVGVIAILTLAAIALHELGHYLVYTAGGYPVVVTLQSVHPAGAVPRDLDDWAKAAGPAVSVAAAALFLWVCRARQAFAWVTAAFTNATLRLFPLTMDIVRAVRQKPPFSDEGEVALAWLGQGGGRLGGLGAMAVLCLALTVLAAREYRFSGRPVLKAIAVYAVSLAVGIGVVLVDELSR